MSEIVNDVDMPAVEVNDTSSLEDNMAKENDSANEVKEPDVADRIYENDVDMTPEHEIADENGDVLNEYEIDDALLDKNGAIAQMAEDNLKKLPKKFTMLTKRYSRMSRRLGFNALFNGIKIDSEEKEELENVLPETNAEVDLHVQNFTQQLVKYLPGDSCNFSDYVPGSLLVQIFPYKVEAAIVYLTSFSSNILIFARTFRPKIKIINILPHGYYYQSHPLCRRSC